MIDLREGLYQEVLTDVEPAALITDTPYSERTHKAYDQSKGSDGSARRSIGYEPWSPQHVLDFVDFWGPRTNGWFCVMTDHVLAPTWERALKLTGRYVFSPLACVSPGSTFRMVGDGPAQWSVWLIVARPKRKDWAKWGSLPGAYVVKPDRGPSRMGGKPINLMRAIVRDYTRQDDLVCDPCAGYGTTLQAAAELGRQAVGAESDPEAYAVAKERLSKPMQADLWG